MKHSYEECSYFKIERILTLKINLLYTCSNTKLLIIDGESLIRQIDVTSHLK